MLPISCLSHQKKTDQTGREESGELKKNTWMIFRYLATRSTIPPSRVLGVEHVTEYRLLKGRPADTNIS